MFILNFIKNWWKARMITKELVQLSDEELKDMGILRSEIDDIAHGRLILH